METERKEGILTQLQNALASAENIKTTTKYHKLLPTKEAHHSIYKTKVTAGYAQRIHPKLIENVLECVSEVITDILEVKKALKHYTLHLLCPDAKAQTHNTGIIIYQLQM